MWKSQSKQLVCLSYYIFLRMVNNNQNYLLNTNICFCYNFENELQNTRNIYNVFLSLTFQFYHYHHFILKSFNSWKILLLNLSLYLHDFFSFVFYFISFHSLIALNSLVTHVGCLSLSTQFVLQCYVYAMSVFRNKRMYTG